MFYLQKRPKFIITFKTIKEWTLFLIGAKYPNFIKTFIKETYVKTTNINKKVKIFYDLDEKAFRWTINDTFFTNPHKAWWNYNDANDLSHYLIHFVTCMKKPKNAWLQEHLRTVPAIGVDETYLNDGTTVICATYLADTRLVPQLTHHIKDKELVDKIFQQPGNVRYTLQISPAKMRFFITQAKWPSWLVLRLYHQIAALNLIKQAKLPKDIFVFSDNITIADNFHFHDLKKLIFDNKAFQTLHIGSKNYNKMHLYQLLTMAQNKHFYFVSGESLHPAIFLADSYLYTNWHALSLTREKAQVLSVKQQKQLLHLWKSYSIEKLLSTDQTLMKKAKRDWYDAYLGHFKNWLITTKAVCTESITLKKTYWLKNNFCIRFADQEKTYDDLKISKSAWLNLKRTFKKWPEKNLITLLATISWMHQEPNKMPIEFIFQFHHVLDSLVFQTLPKGQIQYTKTLSCDVKTFFAAILKQRNMWLKIQNRAWKKHNAI